MGSGAPGRSHLRRPAGSPGPHEPALLHPPLQAGHRDVPHAWLRSQRLSLAEELLETSDLSIEQIADRVGYRSAAVLREQFVLRRGVSPSDYRRTFSRS
ncbi:helix-turn-helix domain-containing protein [Parafrankia sp. BMG5.11]|nr:MULTISPECIES: helix-turn-helix domain-containing protein [unclassified Parafrankia]TCJ33970.1 helix-turn-helix domain-containing protein [Parafrankia sp. BMG5.11]SQD99291.1 hypothetical protein FMEAI12_5210003 [Parafrankia sp. Ea1.12]